MHARCENPNNKSFTNYGARGIKVCERWGVFENFYNDMGDPPFLGAQIDRINNHKDYEPENCRWSDKFVQMNNTRIAIRIVFQGEEMGYRQACRLSGLNPGSVWSRAKRLGITVQQSFDFSLIYRPDPSNPNNGVKKAFEQLKQKHKPSLTDVST
jgi:hypothetical protein